MPHPNTRNKSKFQGNLKFIHRKREPSKPYSSRTDIYVTNKSTFKSSLERMEKLWNLEEPEIVVRALGAVIPRAINLCLQFQRNHHNTLDLNVTTGTVNLIDDFEPLTEDEDYETVTRRNSSICVKLIRKFDSKGNGPP